MWADFLMEFYLYDGGCFRKVASSKMGGGLVGGVVWANVRVLLQEVIADGSEGTREVL